MFYIYSNLTGFSLALPLCAVVPISTTLLLSACGARAENRCVFHDIFPDYLFFECPSVGDYFSYLWQEQVWLWALWFISQIWITGHSTTTWTKLNTTLTLHPHCVLKWGFVRTFSGNQDATLK